MSKTKEVNTTLDTMKFLDIKIRKSDKRKFKIVLESLYNRAHIEGYLKGRDAKS